MADLPIVNVGLPTKAPLTVGLNTSTLIAQSVAPNNTVQDQVTIPAKTCKIEGRRDLLYTRTEYDLTTDQIHDLIGRIYGEEWRTSDPPRKKYTPKDIRDEISSRWKTGHRHGHYRTIDPENGVCTANEIQERARSDQRIQSAAQQAAGRNWLRENNQGVLKISNAAIQLRRNLVPYCREASTFHAAFAAQRARKAGEGAAQRAAATGSQGKTTGARPRRTTRATSATPGVASSQPSTIAGTTRHSAARESIVSGSSSQSLQQLEPSVLTRPNHKPPTRVSHQLSMVHGQYLEIQDDLLTLRSDRAIRFVAKSSAIYKHGGELIHVWNPRQERFDDLIHCDGDVCCKCNDCGRVGELAIKVRRSPTDGLPFVHLGQNSIQNSNGEYIFSHAGAPSIEELTVPPQMHTKKVDMWCTSEGEAHRVTVLGCVAERCAVCSSTTFEQDGGNWDYHADGGFYGENDVSEGEENGNDWSDIDDDGAGGHDNVDEDNACDMADGAMEKAS